MKNKFLLFFTTFLLVLPQVWSQSFIEDFELQTVLTSSYANGSFEGVEGITFSYVHSRNEGLGTGDDYSIEGKGIILRRADEPSSLEFTLPNGVGNLSFDYRKAFTGGNNNRQLAVFVNGVQEFVTPMFGGPNADPTIHNFSEDINVSGPITIKITYPTGTANGNKQITIDNITWTASETPSDYSITVTQAEGGNISPSGTVEVEEGGTIEFTATADACFTFNHWVVDGENAGNTNPYVFTNVTADHTISAVFEAVALETPTAEAQEFCEGATVADLVAEGTEIKWYDAEDATMPLTEDTVLVAGTYYATQTIDGCESEKLAVEVVVNATPEAPVAESPQEVAEGATIVDLVVEGENLIWYNEEGEVLPETTVLVSGTTYYVTQTIEGCESEATPIQVVINSEPGDNCFEEGFDNLTEIPTGTQYGPGTYTNNGITWNFHGQSPIGANGEDYTIDGQGILLRRASDSFLEATIPAGVGVFTFEYRKAYTGGSERQLELLVDGVQVATTPAFGAGSGDNPTVYAFSHTLNTTESVVIRIKLTGETSSNRHATIDNISWTCGDTEPCETPLPTAEAQEFCEGATVADLVAEGTEIKWYDAEDATMPLTEDTVLVAGTYYATQTIDGCESEKLAVEVTLTTAPIIITQPTDQTLSIGETATFSVEAEDAAEFQWSLSADDGITWTEIDGETAFTYTTEPVTEEMNGNLYRVTVINDCGELISDSATLIIQEESCEGIEDFETTDISNAYLDGEFTNNGITWTYGHSRNEDTFGIDGKGLMLRRASDSYLETTLDLGVGEFTFEYRKAFTGGNERQLEIIVNGEQVATTPVFGAGNGEDPTVHTFTHTLNIEGPVNIRIKNLGDTDANRQTVIDNISWTCPEETCETPLPVAENQIFCGEATVADLVAEGENIQWYETQTSTEPLAPEVVLVTGTYYVTQTIDCESERLAVEVLISEGPVFTLQPADQTVNEGETATFTVEVEGALEYQWSVSTDEGTTWTMIDGATEANYTTEAVTEEMDGNQYRVTATNDCGETVSEIAVLTIVGEPCFVEDFETTELPGAYGDGSFTNNGITWTYAHSRNEGDFPIDGKGLMLRRALDSYLEATIPAGAGVFSFEYRKAFTGGNERQLELIVNGVQVATTPVFGDVSGEDPTIYTFTYVLNTTEEVVIRIKNVGETDANRQTVIDNINWTCLDEPCDVPAPIAIGNFEFVAGDTLADLADSLEYTGTLTWYADEELTIVLPNTTLLEDGAVYFVTQTIGECESEALMVETQELGIDSFAFDSFSYYPNPVKDYLSLRNNSKIDNLEIYNLAGAKLMSQTINAVKADLNLKGLDAGIYILKINSGKEVKTVKIIKK